MTSCDSSLILELLEKTEANLKRIEIYNKRFVCLSLNEWRYAARHFATFNVTHDADEERKALSHLKRAYYDSCDVLIDCLLNAISRYDFEAHGFAGVLANIVPGFAESRLAVHTAKEAHFKAQSVGGDEREVAYESLAIHCVNLEKYLTNLEATRDFWAEDIRKQRSRDRLPIIWTIIGIGVSIVLALIFH